MRWLRIVWQVLSRLVLVTILVLVLRGSPTAGESTSDKVRRFTRPVEFEFMSWTSEATVIRLMTFASGATGYLDDDQRIELVRSTLSLIDQELRFQSELARLYGDPQVGENSPQADDVRSRLAQTSAQRQLLQPLAEAVLAEQTSVIIDELGLSLAGLAAPPVGFRFTELPFALIVSPRDVIRQDANIQLETDLPIGERVALEQQVEGALGVSALVVPVGGIGTYPTMIQRTGHLAWVTEVVAHEWIHNFLVPTPLGLNYDSSADLRTMNETTASLMGKEIGRRVLERYYPQDLPAEPVGGEQRPPSEPEPPAFDFRAEMRITREQVDELLVAGLVDEAEGYMEERRLEFWEQGFLIRRLNQAYFAFHGSYADEPGGAAGEDPVGAAVREVWDRSGSPAEFLLRMAGMDSPVDLFNAVEEVPAAPTE